MPRAVSTLSISPGHPTVLFLSRLCHPQGLPLSSGRPAVPQGKRKSPGPSPQPCSAAAPPTHALSDWDIITTSLSPVSRDLTTSALDPAFCPFLELGLVSHRSSFNLSLSCSRMYLYPQHIKGGKEKRKEGKASLLPENQPPSSPTSCALQNAALCKRSLCLFFLIIRSTPQPAAIRIQPLRFVQICQVQ